MNAASHNPESTQPNNSADKDYKYFLFKRGRGSEKSGSAGRWVVFLSLIFSLVSLLISLFCLNLFYEMQALPTQKKSAQPDFLTRWVFTIPPFFSHSMGVNSVSNQALVTNPESSTSSPALNSDLNSDLNSGATTAALKEQLALLNQRLSAALTDQKNMRLSPDVGPLALARMDIHAALASLVLTEDRALTFSFVQAARDELILGNFLAQAKLLNQVLSDLKAANADQIKNQQAAIEGVNQLIQSLSNLSFKLPVDPQIFEKNLSMPNSVPDQQQSASKSAPKNWRETLENALWQTWYRLKSVMIVRDNQKPAESLLTDSVRQATLANILLSLNNAKAALIVVDNSNNLNNLELSENKAPQWQIFARSIDQAMRQVQVSFQSNDLQQQWLRQGERVKNYALTIQSQFIQLTLMRVLSDLVDNSVDKEKLNSLGARA